MLSQAFRVRTIGVGALLRAEQRVGTPRARACAEVMARGELLPDTLALEVRLGRLTNSPNPTPTPTLTLTLSRRPARIAAGR